MDDLVDINTIVTFQWTKNGMIVQEDSRVTITFITISSLEYVSSLSFNPLNITDNGQYHCYVSVVPNVTDSYILNASANTTSNISVNSELKIINAFNINYVFIYLKDTSFKNVIIDRMVNSLLIDMNIVTQFLPSTAITISRTSVVMNDTVIVYTGN